jgi:putative spermidine/putrescine transport system substrate-binding protein
LIKKIAIASLLSLTGTMTLANDINVVTLGGSWLDAQERTMFTPFTAETGININVIPDSDYALGALRAQVESGNITWDVINLRPEAITQACDEGLLENFNIDEVLAPAPDGTPASQDFFAEFIEPCGAPQILYSIQFAYNTNTYGENGPTTVADMFDVEQFPGKRGLQKAAYNNLEWALIADGVDRNEVRDVLANDEGLDRAFTMMDRIKDHVVWWDTAATGIQQIAAGEVDIATNYNGRFWTAAVIEEQPIRAVWDHQIYTVTDWVVVKGRMTDDVRAFLRSTTSPTALADVSKIISYGPARKSSVAMNEGNWINPDNGQDMSSSMPNYGANMATAFGRDGIWWAEHGERINERWDTWLLK